MGVKMDDLIKRSDAIELLLGWSDSYQYIEIPTQYMIESFMRLPSAQQWIPATERSPNGEEYMQCDGLFIVSDGNRVYAEYFDIYDKKCFGEHTMHGFRADTAVTAWCPLPKPWKGSDNG